MRRRLSRRQVLGIAGGSLAAGASWSGPGQAGGPSPRLALPRVLLAGGTDQLTVQFKAASGPDNPSVAMYNFVGSQNRFSWSKPAGAFYAFLAVGGFAGWFGGLAPRDRAVSSASRTSIHAPSARTKPSNNGAAER